VGYRQGQGKVLGNLGTTVFAMGRHTEAIGYQQQALACFREIGDGYGMALTLTNLGEAFCAAGRMDEGMAAHGEALEKFRQVDDLEGEARALSGAGKALAAAGQHAARWTGMNGPRCSSTRWATGWSRPTRSPT